MLTVEALSHLFHRGTANEVYALRNLNLSLPAGQFVVVIGSNGAGKTTLFNVISGVFPPTQGRIHIDGVDVTAWPEHRRAGLVGRVFQDPLMGTAASMTIAENLTLALLRIQPARLRTGVTSVRRQLFTQVLKPLALGLEERLDTRVELLSGGQRQAMTLLMATLAQPKILLLDEHTAALDPATAIKILEMTRQIVADSRLTTLMITHNMQQALDCGDRTLMMDEGQVILDLSAAEKASLSVSDLVEKFGQVKNKPLTEDELLLSAD
jgi:putative ABC transport system ATP-binding protein